MLATFSIWILDFLKFMDPSPDAGSHPGPAKKPSLQTAPPAVTLLLPDTMSFIKMSAYAYKAGFNHPSDLPPPLNLAALTSDTIAPMTGQDTDVPPPPTISPPIMNT